MESPRITVQVILARPLILADTKVANPCPSAHCVCTWLTLYIGQLVRHAASFAAMTGLPSTYSDGERLLYEVCNAWSVRYARPTVTLPSAERYCHWPASNLLLDDRGTSIGAQGCSEQLILSPYAAEPLLGVELATSWSGARRQTGNVFYVSTASLRGHTRVG